MLKSIRWSYECVKIFRLFLSCTCRTAGLTHWGRMTHICVSKLTIIGSDNGLSPGRRQAIIWTNGILLIGPLGTKLQWNLKQNSHIFIHENAFQNIVCEMATILFRPQCIKTIVIMALHGSGVLSLRQVSATHKRIGQPCISSTDARPSNELLGLDYIDGLVQERHNANALAMELRLSCINSSICKIPG